MVGILRAHSSLSDRFLSSGSKTNCPEASKKPRKFVDKDKAQHVQCLAFTPQANFPAHNLNFH